MSAALRRMAQSYAARHPKESSRILETVPTDEALSFLSELPRVELSRVLAAIDPRVALDFVLRVPVEKRAAVFSALPLSAAAGIARRMASPDRNKLIADLAEDVRHALEVSLRHAADSAGAIADTSILTLYEDWTVDHALSRIREESVPVPTVLFVVDRSRRLKGSLVPGQLLGADPKAEVGRLELLLPRAVTTETPVATLAAESAPEPVAVIDEEGTIIGVVTAEALLGLGAQRHAGSIVHPLAALSELYWIGLREALGGLSSGRSRELETAGGGDDEQ
jgi:Mg/Co/Ni transporter MgtE